MAIIKAWVTPFATNDTLYSLTLRLDKPETIKTEFHSFEKRDIHNCIISLLCEEELLLIRDAINKIID